MAWRDYLPFFRKNNPVSDVILLNLWGQHQLIPPRRNALQQAREGYEQNVTVYACVNLVARSMAGIPWVLMQKGATPTSPAKKLMTFRTAAKAYAVGGLKAKSAKKSEIENHPLLTLLEKPNPTQGGAEYEENVMGFFLISGNSFETWITPETGPNKTKPAELWTLRPDRMRIIGGTAGTGQLVGAFQYWVGTGVYPFDPSIILHQKFFAPTDDFFGLSPIQVAARIIDGDNAAATWNQRVLQNNAVPPGIITIKGALQDDARDRLKAELEARVAGPLNARRPLIGEGDIDWKAMGMHSNDLDWLEGRKLNRREIAQAYGVPPELIGDVEAQGYASKEQARKSFYEETILPLMDRRRDNRNNALTPLFGDGLFLDYDRDQIEALHEDAQKLYQGIKQADWLSLDEQRSATGYDGIDPKTLIEGTDPNAPTTPRALLPTKSLPGATPTPGASTGEPFGGDGNGSAGDGGMKAQQFSRTQKAIETDLTQKLDAHFRRQAKALAAHLKAHA